jgi:CheY-like chemotaxis protein
MAGNAKHILLVEDDPGLRRLLRITFNRPEFRITETPSGAEALTLARTDPPNLIVLDLHLAPAQPDGLEVCRRLKNDPSTTPICIVVLTGTTQPGEHDAAIQAGADAYFTKPFSPLALLDFIETWQPD